MMETKELKNLAAGLDALAVFRPLLADPVLAALKEYLDSPSAGRYAAFVAALYEANGGELGRYVLRLCEDSANVYVRTVGAGQTPPAYMAQALAAELDCLQRVADLGPDALLAALPGSAASLPRYEAGGVDLSGSYTHRVQNIHRYGYGVWAANRMFYLDEAGRITPVSHPDATCLDDLVDYEAQRAIILRNTRALLAGKPAANILLTGDAGTGKSSAVKAIGNALFSEGLRIIEVRKDQLRAIPHVLDELAANPLKFVLFIDDLSFLKDDDNYSALKAVLEGSVTAKSNNVVIYATSNRRHIIKEKFSDREGDEPFGAVRHPHHLLQARQGHLPAHRAAPGRGRRGAAARRRAGAPRRALCAGAGRTQRPPGPAVRGRPAGRDVTTRKKRFVLCPIAQNKPLFFSAQNETKRPACAV